MLNSIFYYPRYISVQNYTNKPTQLLNRSIESSEMEKMRNPCTSLLNLWLWLSNCWRSIKNMSPTISLWNQILVILCIHLCNSLNYSTTRSKWPPSLISKMSSCKKARTNWPFWTLSKKFLRFLTFLIHAYPISRPRLVREPSPRAIFTA